MDYPGDADVETYISQFSMIADYNGWQEEERKFHLAASLKDKARQVLHADGRLTSITYAQLCERLVKRFGPGKQSAPNVAALNSLARRSSETIRALADRARPYAKWGYPQVTDEETRDTLLIMPFISALVDKEQRTFVLNRKPATLEEAIEAAELFEATSGIEAKRSASKPSRKLWRRSAPDQASSRCARPPALCRRRRRRSTMDLGPRRLRTLATTARRSGTGGTPVLNSTGWTRKTPTAAAQRVRPRAGDSQPAEEYRAPDARSGSRRWTEPSGRNATELINVQ